MRNVLKTVIEDRRQLQMDMFFIFSLSTALFLFPPVYFLIQILLIKLWEPAGLPPPTSSPCHLHNFLTGSIKSWRRVDWERDREGEERAVRETEQRVDSWTALLCFLSVSWLCEWSSSEELLAPRYPIRLQSYLWIPTACAHTRTHMQTLYIYCTCTYILGNGSKHQCVKK